MKTKRHRKPCVKIDSANNFKKKKTVSSHKNLRLWNDSTRLLKKVRQMAQLWNQLKRRTEEDSPYDFGPSSKRFKYKHVNDESRSSCSISCLKDTDARVSVVSGYSPELGPNENPYYLQNQMLFKLHVERNMRREINNNF